MVPTGIFILFFSSVGMDLRCYSSIGSGSGGLTGINKGNNLADLSG